MAQRQYLAVAFLAAALNCAAASNTEIAFRGIPLDTPGAKEALAKLCAEHPINFQTLGNKCIFERPVSYIWVDYADLKDQLASVHFGEGGAVKKIEFRAGKLELLALVNTLKSRYGEAAKRVVQVENGRGTKFDQEIYVWTDVRKSRITVYSIYDKINEGRFVMESPTEVAEQAAAEEQQKRAAGSKL